VYFNAQRAPVVGSDGSRLYVITPRQPGEECVLSVVVDADSVALTDKKFRYCTMTTVTTIAGKKGTTEFKGGALAAAEFDHPKTLCVDAEGNIFLSHWREPFCFVLISQEQDIVQALVTVDGAKAPGAPTADADGKVVMVPDEREGYYSFDPDAQWAAKARLILHPTAEQIADGMQDFTVSYKHSMAACTIDENIYTRSHNGQLIKFDPVTRTGQKIDEGILPENETYLYFNPYQPEILYLTSERGHAIYTYNVTTKEFALFAGTPGTAGWKDGRRLEAEFNAPVQLIVDKDGSVVVADSKNHCIRKITPDGMVSTLIGKGGVAGYLDGNPEDALFDTPTGVAIDKDYNIYVADYNNNVVRKLSVQ
jgi:sugar lactone lactonase YvrE